MAKIELEVSVSSALKRKYNNIEREYGEDAIIHLLESYDRLNKIEAELEIANETLEKLESGQLNGVSQAAVAVVKTDAVIVQALDSMRLINESYARENERLLKIVNFSEYDEKISTLKTQIEKLTTDSVQLNEEIALYQEEISQLKALSDERKAKIDALEKDLLEQKESIELKDTLLESKSKEMYEKDSTISSLAGERERDKAKIAELEEKNLQLQTQISSAAVSDKSFGMDVEKSH